MKEENPALDREKTEGLHLLLPRNLIPGQVLGITIMVIVRQPQKPILPPLHQVPQDPSQYLLMDVNPQTPHPPDQGIRVPLKIMNIGANNSTPCNFLLLLKVKIE